MRLTCPNCEAQYEVPDEVIPVSGRDVQCSNCGDTWFVHHPDQPEAADAESEDAPTWDAAPEPDAPEHPDPEDEIEHENMAEAAPERQALDPAVKDVLREEAERERAAREHDGGLETQPDLGLDEGRDDEAEKRNREAQARMARLRGEPDGSETPEHPDPDPGTRRNLLPDIDEINSSLNSDNAAGTTTSEVGEVDTPAPEKSGFRRGFMTIVLLAIIGLLLYMYAPQLSEWVPALSDVLDSYVEMVNAGRVWLDDTIGGLMGTLDGLSSEAEQ